ADEVVNSIVKKSVLIADDLLKRRGVGQLASGSFGLTPGNVIEIVVLERAIQIVRVPETGLRIGIQLMVPTAIAAGVSGNVIVHIGRAALPGFDSAEIIHIDERVNGLVMVN